MKRPTASLLLGLAVATSAHAQEASPAPEPKVQRTLIEDGGTRIEELRVRGQLQQVVVSPKGGAKPYRILTGEGAHGVDDGTPSSRGGAGQRVWHVLSF
jgi:hypothetical protein